jgi:hypothetical protein
MRTKTLFLSAVLGLAGASLMAQNTVYSVNAVGYVNVVIPTGFSIIANPMEASANTLAALFPSVPENTKIYRFKTAGGFDVSTYEQDDSGNLNWGAKATSTIAPGEGFFIKNPGAPYTNTFVGTVPTGTLNNTIPAGFSLKSSIVPQEGQLDKAPADGGLGFPVSENDVVYRYANGAYVQSKYEQNDAGQLEWTKIPIIKVGEGFFVKTATQKTWTRTFNINTP